MPNDDAKPIKSGRNAAKSADACAFPAISPDVRASTSSAYFALNPSILCTGAKPPIVRESNIPSRLFIVLSASFI